MSNSGTTYKLEKLILWPSFSVRNICDQWRSFCRAHETASPTPKPLFRKN